MSPEPLKWTQAVLGRPPVWRRCDQTARQAPTGFSCPTPPCAAQCADIFVGAGCQCGSQLPQNQRRWAYRLARRHLREARSSAGHADEDAARPTAVTHVLVIWRQGNPPSSRWLFSPFLKPRSLAQQEAGLISLDDVCLAGGCQQVAEFLTRLGSAARQVGLQLHPQNASSFIG